MNSSQGGRMTTDEIGTERQVWGAPQPPPRRWGTGHALIIGGAHGFRLCPVYVWAV